MKTNCLLLSVSVLAVSFALVLRAMGQSWPANAPCAYAACCTPSPPPLCPTPFNETCEFGVVECPFQSIGSALNLAWHGGYQTVEFPRSHPIFGFVYHCLHF